MAVAAMTPRSLASAFMRFNLPADSVTWAIMARSLQPHRLVITCHFQIAGAARRAAVGDCAFPITGTRRIFRYQFLLVHGRRAFERESQRGDGDAPAHRIAAAGLRTGPIFQRLKLEIGALQM